MNRSLISEVVKDTIQQETLNESLYATFRQAVDTIKGGVIGAAGGGMLAGAGAMAIYPFIWALGLSNPLTFLGLTIVGVAKLGIAAGLLYGTYMGATGQLGDSSDFRESVIIEENKTEFASLSDRAVKTAKARDDLIKNASDVLKRTGDVASSYDAQLKRLTSDMKRAYSDVKRYVTSNKNMFKREEYDAIVKVCDLGIKGKLTYLKDTK